MSNTIPIPFGMQTYTVRAKQWSAQQLINWYAEKAPPEAAARTPIVLLPRPATTKFATVAGATRGKINVTGQEFGVYGSGFYEIKANGTAVLRGTIDTVNSPVTMADIGTQITIVSNPRAWVYVLATHTLTEITDPAFPGSKWVASLDNYFIHLIPGPSGEFFCSNIADGLSFDALNFATAETDSDQAVAEINTHGELWIFGANTIEPWSDSGASNFPFARNNIARIERGTCAPYSVTRFDNTVVWIGDDKVVYRANGYSPLRISTHAIEQLLTDTGDLSDVIGWSYIQDGHTFYVLTKKDEWTIVYDAASGLWHERKTFKEGHWAVAWATQSFNKWLVGGDDGNVYYLDTSARTDDGLLISFSATSPPLHANTNRITMSRLQAVMQVGVGKTTGQGSDPQAMLDWSDDGGETWSYEHWRSMGSIGEYSKRVTWRQLGQFFQRIFRITVTDPVFPAFFGAYGDVDITPP